MPPKDAIQQSLNDLEQFYKVNSDIEILGVDAVIDIPYDDYLELFDEEIND